jgi:hypothetical protein
MNARCSESVFNGVTLWKGDCRHDWTAHGAFAPSRMISASADAHAENSRDVAGCQRGKRSWSGRCACRAVRMRALACHPGFALVCTIPETETRRLDSLSGNLWASINRPAGAFSRAARSNTASLEIRYDHGKWSPARRPHKMHKINPCLQSELLSIQVNRQRCGTC